MSVSRGQPLVHPASLGSVLELSQLRLSVLRLGEDDAVVKSVGLTLPELHQVRPDEVSAPVHGGQVEHEEKPQMRRLTPRSYLSAAKSAYQHL